MKNWRTMVGALCIVMAMVLGAFAGFVYARPGAVGASPETGMRAEDRRVIALSDLEAGPMSLEEAQQAEADAQAVRPAASLEPIELTTPDGNVVTARPVTEEEANPAARLLKEQVFESKEGTITVSPGTRGSWPPGTVDAGGPYGGPNTYEGDPPITFTVAAYDPAIIFFRWDFNDDGKFDFPDQTGGGTIGKWTTQTFVVKQFLDNYYGDVVVQGWDGISTIVNIRSGDNLAETPTNNISLGMFGGDYRWVGWRFTAKRDATVTQLGYYHYAYTIYQIAIRAWPSSVGSYLAACEPVHLTLRWNWCTLATPLTLVAGQDYSIWERIESSSMGIYMPSDTEVVTHTGGYGMFCYGNQYCWSPFQWGGMTWIPKVDFKWQYIEILPDVADDTATLEVHNVAPTVFNVITTPSPGLEGNPTYLTTEFSDPGLDDTWEYRWTFLDGTDSGWQPISKMSGGADVLILHTFYTDVNALRTSLAAACGAFCTKLDVLDWGPTGQNRVPALSELTPYDVLVVGTNYGAIPSGMGDRLADYMDAGGNVVMTQFGFDARDLFGIGGRWQDEEYAPVARGSTLYTSSSLGTIYVPGHPILDGVATLSASYLGPNYGVATGATRVADFLLGTVAIATKEMPNGARSVALPWFPLAAYGAGGDAIRIIANSIRWASQQPDPTVKPMPIKTDPYSKIFEDDEPATTTPQDTFGVHVEVRDDDHGDLVIYGQNQMFYNDFNTVSECSGSWPNPSTWPAGWSADPDGMGWVCEFNPYYTSRAPSIIWSYNDPNYGTGDGISDLFTDTYDFSAYGVGRLEFDTTWHGDGVPGPSDGLVDASMDGGLTFPLRLKEYHHANPSVFTGHVTIDSWALGGASDVVFRFRYVSNDDYGWWVDNVRVTGIVAEVIDGLGGADGVVTVANVPPMIIGGFDTALRTEAQGLLMAGFQVSDPALIAPTEWFAYKVDYGDGTPASWVYTGSLAPPKLKVFVLQTLCSSGNTCAEYTNFRSMLLAQDDVASVDDYNYFQLLSAPTLSTMMQYDVIVVAMNWAYYSYAPFDLARRMIGDRLADYLDSGRGGALTFVGVHSTYSGYNSWDIDGRYLSDKYGAFDKRTALVGASTGLTKVQPDHDLFVLVGNDYNSLYVTSGDMPLSVGGNNNAAGRNGELLARWRSTGNTAIGVKELLNGARTAHIGAFAQPSGSDAGMLLRNAIGWVGGGLPSPKIPDVTHVYGDNGFYSVDYAVIDDDMGWTWDMANNVPVLALPGQESVSHRSVAVSVDNVDPTIAGGIEAFIATEVCVRVSGTAGNTVSVDLFTDGAWTTSVSTTRMNGDPNPPTEKCGLVRVDVTAMHTYAATLTYADPMGGSNPAWLIFEPWREPVTPGHGAVSYKYDFDAAGSANLALPSLKQDLLSGGQGAKIDFVAEAYDPGTDDLAFLWTWGTVDGIPYDVPNPADAVYTIHVHHNSGVGRTDGTLAGPQYLGFTETYFDRSANTGRSPMGTMDFRVRDTAVHAFDLEQSTYYVMLLVLDDDNTRGYPSSFAPNDGVDMQFVVLYLG